MKMDNNAKEIIPKKSEFLFHEECNVFFFI